MFRDRDWKEFGPSVYVPAMQFADAVVASGDQQFSLGSPAASDDDLLFTALAANATAGTTTDTTAVTAPYRTDSKYGRCMIYTISADPGVATAVIELRGWDYLRQPMRERVTCASGATAILYGTKAFAWVQNARVITAATNAVTWKIGTGTRLGLPYKGDVRGAKENGVFVPLYNRDFWMYKGIGAAEVAAGPSAIVFDAVSPGFVKTLKGFNNGPVGSTNDPVLTVTLGGTAIVGLTVTVDVSAAGNEVTDTPTTVGYSANNRLVTGTNITVAIADADASAGLQVGLEITPTQFVPADTTDPMTTITGDPRGTYDPLTAPSGVEHIVWMRGDNSVNASNNGGLHGIKHEFA